MHGGNLTQRFSTIVITENTKDNGDDLQPSGRLPPLSSRITSLNFQTTTASETLNIEGGIVLSFVFRYACSLSFNGVFSLFCVVQPKQILLDVTPPK